MNAITALVEEFTASLHALLGRMTAERIRAAIEGAFAGKTPTSATSKLLPSGRRKPPRQLCPVPGCTNTAAPIFGMVCKEHRNVSKRLLKRYRDERRAARLAGGGTRSLSAVTTTSGARAKRAGANAGKGGKSARTAARTKASRTVRMASRRASRKAAAVGTKSQRRAKAEKKARAAAPPPVKLLAAASAAPAAETGASGDSAATATA